MRSQTEIHDSLAPVAVVAPPPPPASAGRRLAGVDGLRAIAALWVVFFHIHAFSQATFSQVPGVDLLFKSGSTGVSLFLVLSGFCLYVPFAGGRVQRFQAKSFFIRRCRRLMPAYYVSLALALLLTLGLSAQLGFERLDLPQTLMQVVTHVTFTHTLFPSTFYTLNGAYWSLGLEWELYLSLPLLIWGIRRYGVAKTITAVVLVNVVYRLLLAGAILFGLLAPDGAMAQVVLPNLLPGRWAEFAFGMVAAELYATGRISAWAPRAKMLILPAIPLSLVASKLPLDHILFGFLYFSLLCIVLDSKSLVSRMASWRPLVGLGVMSYSLYLVHQPIVQALAYLLAHDGGVSATTNFFILVALIPVIVLLAWILFTTVERRTMTAAHSTTARPSAWQPLRTLATKQISQLPTWGMRGIARLRGMRSAAGAVAPGTARVDLDNQ